MVYYIYFRFYEIPRKYVEEVLTFLLEPPLIFS